MDFRFRHFFVDGGKYHHALEDYEDCVLCPSTLNKNIAGAMARASKRLLPRCVSGRMGTTTSPPVKVLKLGQ